MPKGVETLCLGTKEPAQPVTSMRLLKEPKKLCVQETSPSLPLKSYYVEGVKNWG